MSTDGHLPVLWDTYSLSSVPCLQMTANNVSNWWPQMTRAIESSHFVAMDLELSGLGARDRLNAKQMDDRYEGVVCAAKTRSVLSIGFAFFNFCENDLKATKSDNNCETISEPNSETTDQTSGNSDECLIDGVEDVNRFEALLDSELLSKVDIEANGCDVSDGHNQWKLSAKVFNALCLCEEEYVCEPGTMRFLAGHGFDFNGQCLHGLPYHRGNDTDYENTTTPSLRNLISQIIGQKLPIVLHNGFIDLIFLYQNFYSDLPQDLQTFIADLVELFPAGIFDTKYIADFHERLNRSYLEYLFYERQRFNIERSMKGQINIDLSFPLDSSNSLDIEIKDLSTKILSESDLLVDVCYDYANHGWCKLSHTCNRSHNIDHILDKKKNRSKRMKKLIKRLKKKSDEQRIESTSGGDNSLSIETNTTTKQSKQGVHSAGYDAFMTGYCFAFYLAVNAKSQPHPTKPLCVKSLGISHIVNNIYLTGKDQSLRITASSFAKTSTNHKNKVLRIRGNKS